RGRAPRAAPGGLPGDELAMRAASGALAEVRKLRGDRGAEAPAHVRGGREACRRPGGAAWRIATRPAGAGGEGTRGDAGAGEPGAPRRRRGRRLRARYAAPLRAPR